MTGIPTDTLRTWERRYGFPLPDRTDSGHRRYSLQTCEKLQQVCRLLDHGYRPSTVLNWSEREVDEALRITTGIQENQLIQKSPMPHQEVNSWLNYARSFSGEKLDRSFEQAWTRMAAIDFLEERVAPFLLALGEAWATHKLEVQHEHYVSARLQQFLEAKWRPLADLAAGPMVACATLNGEHHRLGLQLAATALVLADCRILFLGSSVPVENIIRACRQKNVDGLALSISAWMSCASVEAQLKQLRLELQSVPILVGGAGAPTMLDDIECSPSLRRLQTWGNHLHDKEKTVTS